MKLSLALLFVAVVAAAVASPAPEPEPEPLTPGLALLAIKGALIKGAIKNSFGGGRGRRRGFNNGYRRRTYYSNPYRRGKRDASTDEIGLTLADDVENYFLKASIEDSNDCLKSFVCLASSLPSESREELEDAVASSFGGQTSDIDVTSDGAEFQLAAAVGRGAGARQCGRIYARCGETYFQVRRQLEEAWDGLRQQQVNAQKDDENDML